MPNISIGFLVCAYLPGIPLSIAITLLFPCSILDVESDKFKVEALALYLLFTPLLFGLLLDGVRHTVGLYLENKTNKDMPCKHLSILCWNRTEMFVLLKSDSFKKVFYEEHMNYYHLYEFAINMSISCLSALLVAILSYCFLHHFELPTLIIITISLLLLAIISGIAAYGYKGENGKLVTECKKIYPCEQK
ncbi:MAG: hypothetical protein WAW61_12075 [Methylococcaceae bacterium]